MKSILLLLALLLGVSMAHLTIKGKHTPLGKSSSKVHTLPLQDNKQLLINEDKSHGGYQFGTPVRFPLRMDDGVWTTLSNGDMIWTITIKSEGALSMGVSMRDFFIPEGAELYVIGEKEIRGAYSSVNNHASGRFTTWPLEGSSLTLEYYHPAGIKEMPRLNVFRVTHGYKPTGFGDSGTCNNNVRCDDGTWANEIRSVGMLLTAFGSRYCSGALVNNAAGAKTQYFLTANHCSVGSGDSVLFNYQSPACTPNSDGSSANVIGGLVPLVSNVYSDFDLVRIDEAIPAAWNVYYSGLSASSTPATRVVGIHHPSGDVKKISYANKAVYADRWNAAEPGLWHWEISSWDDGTTEPGSSGSPLFDQNKRIVGQLHGGAAACSNKLYDSYGATWASWVNGLQTYLDPNNSGNTLINGTNPTF